MSKDNIPDKIAVKDFRSLILYKKSLELVKEIYEIVKQIPRDDMAMRQQMQRAVTSVTANVAEGHTNLYNKKELTHISSAIGSAGEMRSWYDACLMVGYISQVQYERLDSKTEEIIKMLVGYARKLKQEIRMGDSV